MQAQHIDDFLLNEWLDEQLASTERERVEAHLDGCAECRQRAAALRHVITLFDDLRAEGALDEAPSVNFAAKVVAAIEADSPQAAPLPWKTMLVQAVAALGVLILSSSLLQEAAARWLTAIPFPVWRLPNTLFWATWRSALLQLGNDYWAGLQQQAETWTALLPPLTLPDLSLALWLPLLGLSCLLWLAATRWLVLMNKS